MRQRTERSWKELPVALWAFLLLALMVQIASQSLMPRGAGAAFRQLEPPLSAEAYRALSLGSDRLWSYLLLIRLQLQDAQKGRYMSYRRLDYERLAEWLLTLQAMNPDSDYPAFLAARVYGQIEDPQRVRRMVEVVRAIFRQNPQRYWRRMSEAVLLAKYRVRDLSLALELADALYRQPHSVRMPRWARDMKLIVLDEMGEDEAAMRLIGSLLESGEITDEDERRFLLDRLSKLQQELSDSRQSRDLSGQR
jgi:hypothetical protein